MCVAIKSLERVRNKHVYVRVHNDNNNNNKIYHLTKAVFYLKQARILLAIDMLFCSGNAFGNGKTHLIEFRTSCIFFLLLFSFIRQTFYGVCDVNLDAQRCIIQREQDFICDECDGGSQCGKDIAVH